MGHSPWDVATMTGFTLAVFLMWALSTRCASHSTDHFKFMFCWDGPNEVSVHLKARQSNLFSRMGSDRLLRAQLVRAGLEEIREALTMSSRLPREVTTPILVSQWFGHGRHAAMLTRLRRLLCDHFPGAHILPMRRREPTFHELFLTLTRMGRGWQRTAGGQGLEAVEYKVAAWRPGA